MEGTEKMQPMKEEDNQEAEVTWKPNEKDERAITVTDYQIR